MRVDTRMVDAFLAGVPGLDMYVRDGVFVYGTYARAPFTVQHGRAACCITMSLRTCLPTPRAAIWCTLAWRCFGRADGRIGSSRSATPRRWL